MDFKPRAEAVPFNPQVESNPKLYSGPKNEIYGYPRNSDRHVYPATQAHSRPKPESAPRAAYNSAYPQREQPSANRQYYADRKSDGISRQYSPRTAQTRGFARQAYSRNGAFFDSNSQKKVESPRSTNSSSPTRPPPQHNYSARQHQSVSQRREHPSTLSRERSPPREAGNREYEEAQRRRRMILEKQAKIRNFHEPEREKLFPKKSHNALQNFVRTHNIDAEENPRELPSGSGVFEQHMIEKRTNGKQRSPVRDNPGPLKSVFDKLPSLQKPLKDKYDDNGYLISDIVDQFVTGFEKRQNGSLNSASNAKSENSAGKNLGAQKEFVFKADPTRGFQENKTIWSGEARYQKRTTRNRSDWDRNHKTSSSLIDIPMNAKLAPASRLVRGSKREKKIERLGPGVVVARNFLDVDTQIWLINICKKEGARPEHGFWQKTQEGNKMLNSTVKRGRIYDKIDTYEDGKELQHYAKSLCEKVREISKDKEIPPVLPTHLLLLHYEGVRGIGWHADDAENDGMNDHPIISFSLGNTCKFGYRPIWKTQPGFRKLSAEDYRENSFKMDPEYVDLHSGDVIIWGGPNRMMVHNVESVEENSCPKAIRLFCKNIRYNFTFRDCTNILGREEEFKFYRPSRGKDEQARNFRTFQP